MNYKQNLCAVLVSTLVSLPAFADFGNPYGAVKVGGSWESLSNVGSTSDRWGTHLIADTTTAKQGVFAWGAAVGYRWNTFLIPIRMEADYTYRNPLNYDTNYNDDTLPPHALTGNISSTLRSQTLLGNIYIDLPLTDLFAFFIGGGGGVAFNSIHTTNTFTDNILMVSAESEETSYRYNAAWMATIGMSIVPVRWLALDLSYRYSDLGTAQWNTSDVSNVQLTAHDYNANELFFTFRFIMPSQPKPPCPQCVTYKPKTQKHPEPMHIVPQTKSPAYVKPLTKSPAYEKPNTKSPDYDAERARRVQKMGNIYRDK